MFNPLGILKGRNARREALLAEFLARRRYLTEDVTVFGEQMSELHLDTLTDTLTEDARDYYRYALASYDASKAALAAAADLDDLESAAKAVVEGRHQRACVLALVAGEPMPPRREECFFNPQHGPSHTEVAWTPPGGTERMVPVCAADGNRIARGQAPKMRLVRVGDRYVPMVVAEDEENFLTSTVDIDGVRERRLDVYLTAQFWGDEPRGGGV